MAFYKDYITALRHGVVLLFFFATAAMGAGQNEITGKVVDGKTLKPVIGANCYMKKALVGATSDSNGCFHTKAPQKNDTLIISFMGYKTLCIKTDSLTKADTSIFMLSPVILKGKELSVFATREGQTASSFTIERKELTEMALPLPDPLLALKTLPGVTSANDQTSFYNVRGGSYDENLIYINGFEIQQPQIVRKAYLENPSLVNPLLVDRINLRTGAFPVHYGDKLSSVCDVRYQQPDTVLAFNGMIGATGANIVIKGALPLATRVLFGWRYTDYRFLMRGLPRKGEYNSKFKDFQIAVTNRLWHNLKIEALLLSAASDFALTPTFENYRSYWMHTNTRIEFNDSFERFAYNTFLLGTRANYTFNKRLVLSALTAFYRQDELSDTNLNAVYQTYDIYSGNRASQDSTLWLQYADNKLRHEYWQSKIEISASLSSRFLFTVGLENRLYHLAGRFAESEKKELSGGVQLYSPAPDFSRTFARNTAKRALYSEASYHTEKASLSGGVRIISMPFNGKIKSVFRLSGDYNISNTCTIFCATGTNVQPPIIKEFIYSDAIPEKLNAQQLHYISVGYKGRLFWRSKIKIEAFLKKYSDMISYETDDVRLIYSGENDAVGRAYGFDLYWFWQANTQRKNWISYSYLVDKENLINDNLGWIPGPADRRHQLAFYLDDQMQKFKNSRMHLRITYASGYPYTEQKYRYDSSAGYAVREFGLHNGSRMRMYARFDVGFSQLIKHHSMNWQLREEILNLFGHQNVIGIDYDNFNHAVKHYLSGRVYNISLSLSF